MERATSAELPHASREKTSLPLPEFDRSAVLVMVGMVLVMAIPMFLTLLTIRVPRPMVDPALDPSPKGYTWSLSVYVLPVLVLAPWVVSLRRAWIKRKAFWLTVAILCPLWCLLDVVFGLTFFKFAYPGAATFHFWGWTFDRGWQREIPIEEIAFYLFGFVAMLLVYIWGDEVWFKAYQIPTEVRTSKAILEEIRFSPTPILAGVAIFGLIWLYKKFGPHEYRDGFPGYALFLIFASIVPSSLLIRLVARFINWRSFSLAFFFLIFTSLFWEAAMGVPYQWWGYRENQMMGVFLEAFTNLPIEAAVLWFVACWNTIILYEAIQGILFLGGVEWRHFFRGRSRF